MGEALEPGGVEVELVAQLPEEQRAEQSRDAHADRGAAERPFVARDEQPQQQRTDDEGGRSS